ncbi:MAG: amidohydrolase family protein, partial [Burkholderiales bacterium]|nr:amidohydrolase family protein [Anaerolineae bacterium]
MSVVDRILYNGNIITQMEAGTVSALAIVGERIVAIGADDEIIGLAGVDTVRENLGGKTVIPGITDAHIHWEMLSHSLQEVDIFEPPSKDAALDSVAAKAAQLSAGSWITGWGWTQELWDGREFPTAADLDKVAPEHPVFLIAKSGHASWANSLALRLVGITASTPDPEGGQIVRDTTGQPTGVLLEIASELVSERIPPYTIEQTADHMRHAQSLALASGMTGFHDFDEPSCLR